MSENRKIQIIEDIQAAKGNLSEVKNKGIPQLRQEIDDFEIAIVEEVDLLDKAEQLFGVIPDQQVSRPSPGLDASLNSGSYLARSTRDHSEYLKTKFLTYLRPIHSSLGTAIVSNASSGMVLDVAASAATLAARQKPDIELVIQNVKRPSPYKTAEQLGDILETLNPRLALTLRGAYQTFRDTSKLDRYRQATDSMRDLITNLLDRLAPHEEVKRAVWFEPEKNTKGRPTRKQRVKYAIMGEQSDKKIDDEDLIEIDRLMQNIADVYGELSSFHSNNVIDKQDIHILTESYMSRCVALICSILDVRKKILGL